MRFKGAPMNDQSLEFHNIKDDSSSPGIVRKSFRIPIESTQDIWVEIDSEKFMVLDIGEEGIRIGLKEKSQFQLDQSLNNCTLYIEGQSIQNLNGIIVHFSSDLDNGWQYGIQWVNSGKESKEKMSSIIKNLKAKLLDSE